MLSRFTRQLSATVRFSLYKSADILSLLLPSAHRLCKFVLSKTLSLVSMDNIFSPGLDDDDLLFLNPIYRHRPRPRLSLDDGDRNDVDGLYFVAYKWWNEAYRVLFGDTTEASSVCYSVSSDTNSGHSNSVILLSLKREEDAAKTDKEGESPSSEYALISEGMWLRALKWYSGSSVTPKEVKNLLAADDHMDMFTLQVRLSIIRDSNLLVAKISQMDNAANAYKKAFTIFGVSTGPRIWDFSGQTTSFFSNESHKLSSCFPGQTDEEVLLVLQVYGLSFTSKKTEGREDDMASGQSRMEGSFSSVCPKMNGSTENVKSLAFGNSSPFWSTYGSAPFSASYRSPGCLGLTGLQNLGNTCFMNSAIQCLVHTPKLVDYFLGDYKKDLNYENPLGMHGELAFAFGDLLKKLWLPGALPVAPRMFKAKLASFASQFSGFNQHDSQEFLAFLLDGLHEDLNRVKSKPYIEASDAEGRPDEDVADEYWRNHLARNDSIIVDLCQGQYQSTLVCPVCKKVSVTFDPFMYLSLPLPSTTMRTMTVTVLSSQGYALPFPVTMSVPKSGRTKDLIQALSDSCCLRSDETLLVAEIYNNRILRFLEDPSDLLSLIRDDDLLVAYRLPKDDEASHLVEFMHERLEENYTASCWKFFGIPFVTRMTNVSKGLYIRKQFLKLLDPFVMPDEDASSVCDDVGSSAIEDIEMDSGSTVSDDDAQSDSDFSSRSCLGSDFRFYLTDEKGNFRGSRIKMNEPVLVPKFSRMFSVRVCWPDNMINKYDTGLLSTLPEIFNPGLFTRRPLESTSLYNCLEAFLKEEPLGPEDMWYCPTCKSHQQASKKLDLWRLPEILIIHLKRFAYLQFHKSKTSTFVDFPINDLDLSHYIAHKNSQLGYNYTLYAVSNHYGGMSAGHYTAFVRHEHKGWYEFDDTVVSPISEDNVKTSAAYVLFYKRSSDV